MDNLPPFFVNNAVVYNLDQRQECFNNDSGVIRHNWSTTSGLGCLSGGVAIFEPVPGGAVGSPAAVVNCQGKVHVFIVGGNGRLYVKWQLSPGSSASMSPPWYDMNGYLTSNPYVYTNGQGRIEIFARGGDNAMWTKWQKGSGPCGPWSSWTSLGGKLLDAPNSWKDGYYQPSGGIEIGGTGTDGRNWSRIRATYNSVWGPWGFDRHRDHLRLRTAHGSA